MNKTKIEWTDYTWNPIVGCKHGCWYCYAKKICQRFKKHFPNGFEPTFHQGRLIEPALVLKPSKIFVCSIADLFASWTPLTWRNEVLDAMVRCPIKHQFQMLTKNPENIPLLNYQVGMKIQHFNYPDNWWFGTTVTSEMADEVNIDYIKKVPAKIRFVSFEPLLGEIDFDNHSLEGIEWVIIGKLTGSRKVELKRSWVIDILEECNFHKIPVFIKNNLGWSERRQEFPK